MSADGLDVDFGADVVDTGNSERGRFVPSGEAAGVDGAGQGGVFVDGVDDRSVSGGQVLVEGVLGFAVVGSGEKDYRCVLDGDGPVEVFFVPSGAECEDGRWG